MKRFFMFSLVIALVLVSSASFAADFPSLNISIAVPQNWQARQNTYPTIGRNVPDIELTDMVDDGRWLWIFLDDKMDASGTVLSLNEVGNRYVQWHTNNNRRADRIDDRNTKGYFELEYYLNALNTRRQVFIDNDFDARITAGRYLCYLYPDTVTQDEALAILSDMTINGISNTPKPSPETDTSQDVKPTPKTVSGGGGGGGGCNAGAGLFASLFVGLSAMIFRKR